jgi:hypothetical protein
MGDCRIRLLIARHLLFSETPSAAPAAANDNQQHQQQKSSEWHVLLNKIFTADTTVREVCEDPDCRDTLLPLLEQSKGKQDNDSSRILLWDCTVHPPKDITDWPVDKFSDVKGLKSKTLFDAGWFPSGTLRVSLQRDGVPSIPSSSLQYYDDHQYNLPQTAVQSKEKSAPAVQLVAPGTNSSMLPSQVLDSVTKRFDDDKDTTTSEASSLRMRRQNQKIQEQKEQQRFQKLEARIRRLDQQSSNKSNKGKPVSDQVRRMLVKSRATGADTLKQRDRVYFHIVVDYGVQEEEEQDIDGGEEFRYFSIQDTVARILSNFSNKRPSEAMAEFLVKRQQAPGDDRDGNSSPEEVVYRRLPGAMRVYEAIEQKYLEPEVNNIVIRWYYPSTEESTTSILEEKSRGDLKSDNGGNSSPNIDQPPMSPSPPTHDNDKARPEIATDHSYLENEHLTNLIQAMDDEEQKKSKKKKGKSSTSSKVRQMLMKSKSKGDAKRLKMEERFYFELITVVTGGKSSCESQLAYLGRKDRLGRILRDCVKAEKVSDADVELLVPLLQENSGVSAGRSNNKFKRLTNLSMTFQEAEMGNLFQPFDRIVVVRWQSS